MNITAMRFSEDKLKDFFTPILSEWFQILDNYSSTINIDEPDALYWYNERATLSTLAGAAWKCGCYALEEYSSTKREKEEIKSGRIDLWLQYKDTEYIIEAKQKFVSISSQASNTSRIILDALEAARQDAENSKGETEGLGMLFVAPYFPASLKNKAKTQIQNFINQLNGIDRLNEMECDLLAYTFSDQKYLFEKDDNAYYPGIALLGKYA